MKILRESKDFEVAVGQVWVVTGDKWIARTVGNDQVCWWEEGEGLLALSTIDQATDGTLIKHQSGAEIDLEVYEYLYGYGNEFPDDTPASQWELYAIDTKNWRNNQYGPLKRKHLYRRPKAQEKPSEPELPYVDYPIDEHGYELIYLIRDLKHSLQGAMFTPNFIGFVFADGSMSRYSPWSTNAFFRMREEQAERANHVRFKREVAK